MLGGAAAAIPVLYGIESAATALAAPAQGATAARQGAVANATDELARGGERRYNAPLLAPGTRLVLPAGIQAVAVKDYYSGPHLASFTSAWPRVTASDGTTVDASIVPEDRKSTRLNSSHANISYAVFCLKKKQ